MAGKIRRQSPAKTKTKATELFEGAAMSARTFRLLIGLNGRFYELWSPERTFVQCKTGSSLIALRYWCFEVRGTWERFGAPFL